MNSCSGFLALLGEITDPRRRELRNPLIFIFFNDLNELQAIRLSPKPLKSLSYFKMRG
jgi:hypothetical protein